MIEYGHDSQSIALSLKLTVSLSKPLIVSMEVPTCGDHPAPSQLSVEPINLTTTAVYLCLSTNNDLCLLSAHATACLKGAQGLSNT
jgi:hypothetical protein